MHPPQVEQAIARTWSCVIDDVRAGGTFRAARGSGFGRLWRIAGLEQLAEPAHVPGPWQVVEQHVRRATGRLLDDSGEVPKLRVGVDVPSAGDAVQPKVGRLGRHGRVDERVDDVNETQLATQRVDRLGGPGSTRFPQQPDPGRPIDIAEEGSHSVDVLVGRPKRRGALEQHSGRAKDQRARHGAVPGAQDDRGRLKPADGPSVLWRQWGSKPPIRRARGVVRDQLPGLERELEVVGGLGAPPRMVPSRGGS